MQQLRAAVIGCGKIGSGFADDPRMAGDIFTHAEAYSKSHLTELVAVCDSDNRVAEACADRWSVMSSFVSLHQMLQEVRPEVVSICTPDSTHFEVVSQVLRGPHRVKGILCEKPLASTLEQAFAVQEMVRETQGLVFGMMYLRRHALNIQNLQAFIQDGGIGRVTAVTGYYTKGTIHNGSHWFDLLRMLCGEVATVEASDNLREPGTDPSLDVTLHLTSGAVATLRALPHQNYSLFEMDIMGERGRARVTDSGHVVKTSLAKPSTRYTGYTELVETSQSFGHRRDVALHAVEDLVNAIGASVQPKCGIGDGIWAQRIADAALRAASTSNTIAV